MEQSIFLHFKQLLLMTILSLPVFCQYHYLLLAEDTFQPYELPLYVDCFPRDYVLEHEKVSFLPNHQSNISSFLLKCFTDLTPLFQSFYLIKEGTILNLSEKDLHQTHDENKIYDFITRDPLEMLYCEHYLINSNFSYVLIFSEATLVYCMPTRLKLFGNNLQTLKGEYNQLFPLIKEYTILQDQLISLTSTLIFSDEATKSSIEAQPAIVSFKKLSNGTQINLSTGKIIVSNLLDRVDVKIELNHHLGILLKFKLPVIIYDPEILAFSSENDTKTIFIIGKSFQKNFVHELVSQNQLIRISCIISKHKNQEHLPEILECPMTQGLSFDFEEIYNSWKLHVFSPEDCEKLQLQISLQSIDSNYETELKIQHKEIILYSYLALNVDPLQLGSWIIIEQGEKLVVCEFFGMQSNYGIIINAHRIICPIPEKNKKYFFREYGSIKYQVQAKLAQYLHIIIYEKAFNDQTPSFTALYRYLNSRTTYDFSPLDPQIIVAPALESSVSSNILSRSYFFLSNLAYMYSIFYQVDTVVGGSKVLNAIFNLNAYSVALITVDLRFLSSFKTQFRYGVDWDLSITVGTNISFDDLNSAKMPETFLLDNYEKSEVHEFILLARVDLEFKVDIIISNTSFLNVRYAFLNSTSVEILSPYRSYYGLPYSFYAMITAEDEVTLPINLPELDVEKNSPDYWLELGSIRGDKNLVQHNVENGRNQFNPKSLYWGTSLDYVTMPYLPFFSNCKAFDKYIPIFSLFEQNPACNLIPPENTIYVKPFGFGSQPVADDCEQIQLSCIYDENLDQQTEFPRWFDQGANLLFYVTKSPQPASSMDKDDFNYNKENFVKVTVEGNYEEDKIPSLVKLDFQYYQVSETEKRLVSGKVTLDNFITPTDDQRLGKEVFPYTLQISFVPLGHTDLLIAFEFESYMYMVLYLFIGIFAVIYTLILFIYHKVLSRRRKKIQTKYWEFIKLVLPSAAKGMLLAILPLIPVIVILAALMQGEIWDWPIHGCGNNDEDCYRSIFDAFTSQSQDKLTTARNSKEFIALRHGRTGSAFIITGFLIMVLISKKFVKKIKKEEKQEEAFDGNVWLYESWLRISLVFYCILQVVAITAIIQFSFTDTYGNNVFVFIGIMKLLGMTLKLILDKVFQDRLFAAPMLAIHGVMESVVTFGAADFLNFLISYYVDLGIQMVERQYAGHIYEGIASYLEEKYSQITRLIKKAILDEESTEDSEDDPEKEKLKSPKNNNPDKKNSKVKDKEKTEAEAEEDNKDKKNRSSMTDESSDSNIILSDHEASMDSSMSMSVIGAYSVESDLEESGDEFETEMTKRFWKKEKDKEKQHLGDYGMSSNLHDGAEDEAVDELCDFSVDTLILLFTPIYTLLMWVFYDETKLAESYGIAESDVIFYLLHSILIIPFQMTVDVFHYNMTEYFHGLPIFDRLKQAEERFKARTTPWKGDDDDIDRNREEVLQHIDQFCFSSQFYFIVTIYILGMLFVIFGVQTIIAADYDIFQDVASYYVLVTILVICLSFYYVTLFLAKTLKIWNVSVERYEMSMENIKSDDISLYDPTTPTLAQKFGNWEAVEKIKSAENRFQEAIRDLQITRFTEDEFKSNLILNNHFWFTSNIREVFTPTTLKKKRGEIIHSFKEIYGDLSPRLVNVRNEEEVPDKKMDFRQKKFIKKQLADSFIFIIRHWKARAALIRKIRSQVSGIIEASTEEKCQFCGINYYLRSELMPNIETLFIQFLKENPTHDTKLWSVESWQESFKKNARFRTLCFNCSTKLLDHHRQVSINENRLEMLNRMRIIPAIQVSKVSSSLGRNVRGMSNLMHTSGSRASEKAEPHYEPKETQIQTDESVNISRKGDDDADSTSTIGNMHWKVLRGEKFKQILKAWLEASRDNLKHRALRQNHI